MQLEHFPEIETVEQTSWMQQDGRANDCILRSFYLLCGNIF
jgi:hypothetical protein